MHPKSGTPWTEAEERELAELVLNEATTAEMALKLGRSPLAIQNKINQLRQRAKGKARRYATRCESPLPNSGATAKRRPSPRPAPPRSRAS